MRWLDERGRGYVTPGGRVPIVPAAIIYDLVEGDAAARPAAAGYAACEAATAAVPQRGRVGAGTGAAVGKILGRDRATPAGIGYAAARAGPASRRRDRGRQRLRGRDRRRRAAARRRPR